MTTAKVGDTVLYTRDAEGNAFPAIVVRLYARGGASLCAFTPAPEPIWNADHDADGKPRTWRHLNDNDSKGKAS